MHVKNFYELNIWKRATDLTVEVYTVTAAFPKQEMYRLAAQLERAAVSVGANIAEGFGKPTRNDKLKFAYIARGSLLELENFLFLIIRLKYVSETRGMQLIEEYTGLSRGINRYISQLRKH